MPLVSIQSTTVDRALRYLVYVLIAAIALVLVLGAIWLVKHRYDTAVVTKANAKSNAQAEGQMAVANSTMAVEQKADTAVVTTQRQELRNASNPPVPVHDGLSDRQRRGCVILRQQGQDIGRIATCRSLAR